MSRKLLGETFDIHGGGLDLMFPHHENEIAQSECCHGKPMVRYWVHNGLMKADAAAGKVGGRGEREKEQPSGSRRRHQDQPLQRRRRTGRTDPTTRRRTTAVFPAANALPQHDRLRRCAACRKPARRWRRSIASSSASTALPGPVVLRPAAPHASCGDRLRLEAVRLRGSKRSSPAAPRSWKRWTTTSTRARPSANCLNWSGHSIG